MPGLLRFASTAYWVPRKCGPLWKSFHASANFGSIRALNGCCIGAAGYPEGHVENPDKEADLRHQKAKVDAVAELLVSQFFLVNEFFLKWRDRLHRGGVRVPIIPGLLLPSSAEALFRMSKLCGVSIPGSLRAKLERFADDPGALKEIGWNHLEARMILRHGTTPGFFFLLGGEGGDGLGNKCMLLAINCTRSQNLYSIIGFKFLFHVQLLERDPPPHPTRF